MNELIIGILAYLSGLLTGIFAGRFFYNKQDSKALNSNLVLFVVTAVWAVSMIVDIATPSYETPVAVHGLMGAIVGFFYRSTKRE